MFTAALEEIFRRMEIEVGININGERMNNLRFADDIILFAEKEEHLSKLLNDLNQEGREDGMKMNKKKTKIMCNGIAKKRRRKGIMIDGEQLEEVDEYKYLGRLLTSGNEMAKEVDERITSAWKRFGQYSTFMRDQRMPLCLKRKIMNTVILPSMTYGAETWSLTNHQREKLAVTQRSMERSMMGVTKRDKIRNEDLRSRTNLDDNDEIIMLSAKLSSKNTAEEEKETVVNIARMLCEDYIEDRLIRSGLQLKERKLGKDIDVVAGNQSSSRPTRNLLSPSSTTTATCNLRTGSRLGSNLAGSIPIKRSISVHRAPSLDRGVRCVEAKLLSVDKKNPEYLTRVLISLGETMEIRHSGVYIDVLSQLNICLLSELTLKRAFCGVAKYLFSEDITWAKIISLFAFTGALAVDCVSHGANMYVGMLKHWIWQFISDNLADWIVLQGGWGGMADHFVPKQKSQLSISLLLFLSLLIILLAYLLNFITSKYKER
eukprot:gene6797-7563_t